jgi:hypothetical protein
MLAFPISWPFIRLSKPKKHKGHDRWLLFGIAFVGVLGLTAFMLYDMKLISGCFGNFYISL